MLSFHCKEILDDLMMGGCRDFFFLLPSTSALNSTHFMRFQIHCNNLTIFICMVGQSKPSTVQFVKHLDPSSHFIIFFILTLYEMNVHCELLQMMSSMWHSTGIVLLCCKFVYYRHFYKWGVIAMGLKGGLRSRYQLHGLPQVLCNLFLLQRNIWNG